MAYLLHKGGSLADLRYKEKERKNTVTPIGQGWTNAAAKGP